ncbi:MogA/MoaB family molybdenum cofactor biosynthesis protein [Cellulomonas triticagri]|uniref:MogA/MoaB family molybdenum cofactor biosynthesis protein n=1 Tax=Cellulomonas triticagri TaxID=2483352 RepID=A0A3M2JAF0_9CELL|nr:MogA/MoaB family molybdenum cofactor biosynthesis protein [Cellulomonas triticagri]RMI09136.1 MogA/MoaB family molybdenum cofactor biosynthesis protein [Cellulomonas triticagri]
MSSDAVRALVVTVSTRAAAGVYPDETGPALAGLLREAGFLVAGPRVVPDGASVGAALRTALAEGHDVVVTAGGTGIARDDQTPEHTLPVLDRVLPGIPEAVRAVGAAAGSSAAVLSRGVAGTAGRTLVVNLPGSVRAVREAAPVLIPALRHGVDQLRGGDHPAVRRPAP